MSDLRSLAPIVPVTASSVQMQLAVYNTNISSAQNGGCCCCWVVPAGVTWAVFELWGGGADGGGGCCCSGNTLWGAGSGNYIRKSIQVTAGCYFCLCAGSSGCCSQSHCGTCGFSSWVYCGANNINVAMACGGFTGCTGCFRGYMGCTGICYPICSCGYYSSAAGSICDLAYPTMQGTAKESNYCWSIMWNASSGAPKYGNNTRIGVEHCTLGLTHMGCSGMNGSKWPGGGGQSGTGCGGGCCWGGWGAGGLVLVTYG